MNYYAQGGQAYGLQSLAQELPKYGRHGDSIVAHINPQEAGILKALGGSGTINPDTGLPEFFIKKITKPFQQAVAFVNPFNPGSGVNKLVNQVPVIGDANKALNNVGTQIFQPLEKAIVQPASRGLASFDKAVGNAIPGGWGTVGQVALSAMGAPVPLQVAFGAARGSGVMRKGGNFNLQGAMVGGATAYAMSELGEYLRAAAPGAESATNMATLPESAVNLSSGVNAATGEIGSGLAGNASGMLIDPSTLTSANTAALNSLSAPLEAGFGSGLQVAPPPSIGSQIMSGNFGDAFAQAGQNISNAGSSAYDSLANAGTSINEGISNLGTKASNFYDAATSGDTYTQAIDRGMSNASQTGSGIKNLITGPAGVSKAASALSGVNPVAMTGMATYGAMTLADLDAQRDFLKQQQAAGNIAQAEYDAALAEINRQRDYASDVVSRSPFSTNPNRDTSIGDTYYGRNNAEDTLYGRGNAGTTLYAQGGDVKGYFGGGIMQMIGDKIQLIKDAEAKNFVANNPINVTRDTSAPPGPNIYAQERPSNVNSYGTFYEKTPELETLYDKFRRNEYAAGGSIDDEYGIDEARGIMQGNLQNGLFAKSMPSYAAGGQPRFLSGGGDGMSDDIKATINDNQPARLADGEFVVPADVVSHLGNGSSKAGAKQLYSMMDKVRTARTGRKAQGKQINPRKYLAA